MPAAVAPIADKEIAAGVERVIQNFARLAKDPTLDKWKEAYEPAKQAVKELYDLTPDQWDWFIEQTHKGDGHMSEAIQFLANIGAVQAGDDEIRLALAVLDTDKDRAAAVEMIGRRNRILHVSAYQQRPGYDWDQLLVEFRCSIAQLKAAVVISPKKPPMIKFDIPASDGLHALRLVGYDDQVIRFEVSDEGDQPKKEKKPKKEKEPKGPYSQLWRHLYLAGFIHAPGVKETIAEHRITDTEPEWEILHRVFGVGGASLAAISPDEIYAKFPPNEYPQAGAMVEQAKKKAATQENS